MKFQYVLGCIPNSYHADDVSSDVQAGKSIKLNLAKMSKFRWPVGSENWGPRAVDHN